MMRTLGMSVFIAAISIVMAGFAMAEESQSQPGDKNGGKHEAKGEHDAKGDREGPPWAAGIENMSEQDARELIETYRMTRLTDLLNLSDEETVVMVRHFREYREKRDALFKQRRELLDQLKAAIHEKQGDAVIEQKLAALIANETAYGQARRETFAKAGEKLSSEQRAKLFVFMSEFDGEVRKMIQKARQKGGRDWNGRDGQHSGPRPEGERSKDGVERTAPPSNADHPAPNAPPQPSQ